MCGTASSQKCHVDLLQFVMLSIYHLFSRISIHLQRYFIKIRAAVHYFVQQTPLQDVLPLWNLFLTSVRVSGTIQAWTGTANGWYRTIKYRRIPGKRKLRFRVGNLSAVRQRTESIGFSPLRGSHRAARRQKYHYSVMALSYGEAVIHLPSTYRSFPQWEIIAFVTDVAHHHRNVTEECVFNFQGAG